MDVAGTVTGDGTITFLVVGDRAALTLIASRESATPPRLVLTVVESTPVSVPIGRPRR